MNAHYYPFVPARHFRLLRAGVVIRLFMLAGLLPASASMVFAQPAYVRDAAAAVPDQQRIYSIPGGTLEQVLMRFADSSGISLIIDAALTEGKYSDGLNGGFTVEEAFSRLLRGQRLRAVHNADGSYSLRGERDGEYAGADAGAGGNMHSLGTVSVEADVLDPDDARPKAVSTATKIPLPVKDIPQTIESIEVSKFKTYGINDLSVMLDGVAGVDTTYDMRGDGIMIRGFEASSGDIYRDGIRASGQIRRSTANTERIEVLKGPASVLYGRGLGGGVVNMISKEANFDAISSVGIRGGEWSNRGATVDLNHVVSPYIVVRLTADQEEAHSFRRGIKNRNKMVSPSILLDNQNGLRWLAQYTYDEVWRRPDRAPSYNNLPSDVSHKMAYAHPDDYVEDRMHMWRSVLSYEFAPDWSVKWTSALHKASQNFDHLYGGSYCQTDGTLMSNGKACKNPGMMTFTRAWQKTDNRTLTNMLDLIGKFDTGPLRHDVLVGIEYSDEERRPVLATSGSDPSIAYVTPVNPYAPDWSVPKTPRGEATTINRHEAKSKGIYFQNLISFTPQWKLLAGIRFDRYEFSSHDKIKGLKRSYDDSTRSPRVGLIWQPVEAHSFYVSYSKNFAPYGGRGLISVSVSSDAVYDEEPQYSRQYEVGVKSDWMNGRLSSQISLYELELYNKRYQPDPENDPYNWAVRGKERSRGVEMSLTGRLARHWYIRSSVGMQQAKIIEDKAQPASEGNYKDGVARKNGSIYLRYVPHEQWYGELGVIFKGSIYNDLANTSERSGYAMWNASIGYRALPWTATLAVTNLTDKRYWRSTSMPGTPRAFLLSATYAF